MSEEKDLTPTLNSDDYDVLRLLLHSIKGLSPVSSSAAYVAADEEESVA